MHAPGGWAMAADAISAPSEAIAAKPPLTSKKFSATQLAAAKTTTAAELDAYVADRTGFWVVDCPHCGEKKGRGVISLHVSRQHPKTFPIEEVPARAAFSRSRPGRDGGARGGRPGREYPPQDRGAAGGRRGRPAAGAAALAKRGQKPRPADPPTRSTSGLERDKPGLPARRALRTTWRELPIVA